MRLVRVLRITPEELFDQLENDIRELVASSGGEKTPRSKIAQGYRVTLPKTKKAPDTRIRISAYDRSAGVFEMRVHIPGDLTISRFESRETPDGTEVSYEMTSEAFDSGKHGVMHGFSEMFYLGRMSTYLQNLERHALDLRAGIVPEARQPKAGPRLFSASAIKRLLGRQEET